MNTRVLKLILVTDDDTCDMIIDHSMLPYKQRELAEKSVEFKFTDKHNVDHELHLVAAEEV